MCLICAYLLWSVHPAAKHILRQRLLGGGIFRREHIIVPREGRACSVFTAAELTISRLSAGRTGVGVARATLLTGRGRDALE